MRRVFPILVALFFLMACAAPALAVGNGDLSNRYSALPFQYMYFNGFGGPFEYPAATTRSGSVTRVTYDAVSMNNEPSFYAVVSSQANYLDTNFYFPSNVYQMTFEMRNALASINNSNIMIAAFDGDVIWKITVYGNYLTPYLASDNTVKFKSTPFNKSFVEESSQLELKDYLTATFYNTNVDKNNQLFGYLAIDVELDILPNTTVNHFEIYTRSSALSYSAPDLQAWISSKLGQIAPTDPGTVDFNVGTFLGNSVAGFMETPIWGEFTFGHLLGIALTLGVLFFALKLLV